MADRMLLGKCGLYCDVCCDHQSGECEGCGCTQPGTAAEWHNQHCAIALCVAARGPQSCADCDELPCTQLIQFCYDPIWRSHLPVIENCRRIRRVGVDAWLAEQQAYWRDEKRRQRWLNMHARCGRLHAQEAQGDSQ